MHARPLVARTIAVAVVLLGLHAGPGRAAPPDVPDQLTYQGVLLDDLGDPRTGNVDLVVRLYDGVGGSATLLYTQRLDATPLDQGVFSLVIGPTGEATDDPDDPLTTDLGEVFTGDLVAGPDRFIELGVDGDLAQSRVQILASPLALRARSAETADTADSAVVAQSAATLNGLDSTAVNEIYQHFDFDGGPPANDDPREGLADVDGDGKANFIDSDNDGDGLPDADEVGGGSDINLVTPTISGASPSPIDFGFPATVTITGTSFEPGMGVVVGSQSPTPTNVTENSFDVTVGPQSAGAADVQVTRLNGESAFASGLVEFSTFTPTITGVSPSMVDFGVATSITVTGTNFEPGISVVVGSESPAPANVTPSSFDVTVGPQAAGFADVQVTRLNGVSGLGSGVLEFALFTPTVTGVVPATSPSNVTQTVIVNGTNFEPGISVQFGSENPVPTNITPTSFEVDVGPQTVGLVDVEVVRINSQSGTGLDVFEFITPLIGIATPHGLAPPLAGFGVKDAGPSAIGNFSDREGDRTWELSIAPGPSSQFAGLVHPAISPSQMLVGIVPIQTSGICRVEVRRDGDGNMRLFAGESVVVEDLGVSGCTITATSLSFLSDDTAVAAYGRSTGGVAVAADRNGDDDYLDPGEIVEVAPTSATDALVATAVDASDGVAVLHRTQDGGSFEVRLAHDRNADGDFDDAGEDQLVVPGSVGCLDVTFDSAGRAAVVYASASPTVEPTLLRDLDGDGDFDDAGEQQTVPIGSSSGSCALATAATGLAVLASTTTGAVQLLVDTDGDGAFATPGEIAELSASGGQAPLFLTTDSTGNKVYSLTQTLFVESQL